MANRTSLRREVQTLLDQTGDYALEVALDMLGPGGLKEANMPQLKGAVVLLREVLEKGIAVPEQCAYEPGDDPNCLPPPRNDVFRIRWEALPERFDHSGPFHRYKIVPVLIDVAAERGKRDAQFLTSLLLRADMELQLATGRSLSEFLEISSAQV